MKFKHITIFLPTTFYDTADANSDTTGTLRKHTLDETLGKQQDVQKSLLCVYDLRTNPSTFASSLPSARVTLANAHSS